MTLPIDRTALVAAQTNQVPNALIRSALNIAAIQTPYDTIDELFNYTSGLVSASTLSRLGVINVMDYNASGSDTTTTGSITSGLNALTVARTSTFVIGQGIIIAGAGAAGVDLITTIASISNLVITLADAASTTVVAGLVEHDDTVAINAAATAATGVLLFPYTSGGYKTTGTVTIPRGVNVEMVSPILYMGLDNVSAIVVGDTSASNDNVKLSLRVVRNTQSDWSDEGCIGIKLINTQASKIEVFQSENFTIGLQCMGYNAGFVYNQLHLFDLFNSKYAVDLINFGTGWTNENTFYGGKFALLSETGVGVSRYGVRITSVNGNSANNNVFYHPSFELKQTNAGVAEAVPVKLSNAQSNRFLDCRAEDCHTTIGGYFDVGSSGNAVEFSYGLAINTPREVNVDAVSAKNIITNTASQFMLLDNAPRVVFDGTNLFKRACYYDGSTTINIPGVFLLDSFSGFAPISYSRGSIVYGNSPNAGYLDFTLGFGIFIKTDQVKKFAIQFDGPNSGRYYVKPYDISGNFLGDNPAIPYARSTSNSSMPWSTDIGGSYKTGGDNKQVFYFEVDSNTDYIALIIGKGSATLKIRGFQLIGYGWGGAATWTGIEEGVYGQNVGTTIPTIGNWESGKRIYKPALTASSTEGIGNITSGTQGTLSSVTGSITSGSATLTVNSATNLSYGNYITIAGVSGVKKIILISGTTVTLDSNSNATVSGAAVAYSAASFKTIGATGA